MGVSCAAKTHTQTSMDAFRVPFPEACSTRRGLSVPWKCFSSGRRERETSRRDAPVSLVLRGLLAFSFFPLHFNLFWQRQKEKRHSTPCDASKLKSARRERLGETLEVLERPRERARAKTNEQRPPPDDAKSRDHDNNHDDDARRESARIKAAVGKESARLSVLSQAPVPILCRTRARFDPVSSGRACACVLRTRVLLRQLLRAPGVGRRRSALFRPSEAGWCSGATREHIVRRGQRRTPTPSFVRTERSWCVARRDRARTHAFFLGVRAPPAVVAEAPRHGRSLPPAASAAEVSDFRRSPSLSLMHCCGSASKPRSRNRGRSVSPSVGDHFGVAPGLDHSEPQQLVSASRPASRCVTETRFRGTSSSFLRSPRLVSIRGDRQPISWNGSTNATSCTVAKMLSERRRRTPAAKRVRVV